MDWFPDSGLQKLWFLDFNQKWNQWFSVCEQESAFSWFEVKAEELTFPKTGVLFSDRFKQ